MASWERRESLIIDTYEDKRSRGKAAGDIHNVTPGKPDMPGAGPHDGADEGYASRQASHYESAHARRGQMDATKGYQTPGPFTPTNGMHPIGQDHVSVFADAVNRSGGVRQGSTFVSDPAIGVARAGVHTNDAYKWIDVQTQGSGDTFEVRQHRRWRGMGG